MWPWAAGWPYAAGAPWGGVWPGRWPCGAGCGGPYGADGAPAGRAGRRGGLRCERGHHGGCGVHGLRRHGRVGSRRGRGGLRYAEGGRRGRCGRRLGRAGRRGETGRRGLRGLLLRLRVLVEDLAAEVPEQRLQAAVESLADGGEAPPVLPVEVAEHHGPLGAELGSAERVAGDLLAPGYDPQVARPGLRHLAGAVDRGGEGQLVDALRHPVEGDAEGLGVTGLRAEELDGLLRRLRLVEEDEVPVVREPLVGVEAEAADVEGQSRSRDLHADVQIGAGGQITDPGLVAPLEFPGHA